MMKDNDPNITEKEWNWTSKEQHKMYFIKGEGALQETTAVLPYFTYGNSEFSAEQPDMSAKDGWVLVHRDFGSPDGAQHFPFFTLYNKYRGIFRVMLYNAANREGSFFVGELSLLEADKYSHASTPVFNFADENSGTLENYNKTIKLTSYSRMSAYSSWAVFDFMLLGFDPELGKKQPILSFKLTHIENKDIKLNTAGDIQLYQSFQASGEAHPGNTSMISEVYAMGTDLYLRGGKGYATYKSVKSFLDNEVRSPAGVEKNGGASWFPLVASMASGAMGNYLPMIMAMGSVLQSFVGGANTASQWEPLNFTGQLQLETEGTLQTRRDLWHHNFFMNPGEPENAKAQRPLREVAWGIYNFQDSPAVRSTYNKANKNVTTKLFKEPSLVVNTHVGMDLVSTRVAFVYVPGPLDDVKVKVQPSAFMTVQQAMATGHTYERLNTMKGKMAGLLWEFKFKTKNPTEFSDSEILVIKRTGCLDQDGQESLAWHQAHSGLSPAESTRQFQEKFPDQVPMHIGI
jgi:hypothetical protein